MRTDAALSCFSLQTPKNCTTMVEMGVFLEIKDSIDGGWDE